MTNYKVPFFVPDIDQREIDAVTKNNDLLEDSIND